MQKNSEPAKYIGKVVVSVHEITLLYLSAGPKNAY